MNAVDVTLASYSNYGTTVDLAAPGGDYTRYPANKWWYDMVLSTWSNNSWLSLASYVWACGTSMAAPHVSAVAALILSVNDKLKPITVASIMYLTATDKGESGFDKEYGYGVVNACNAVKLAELTKIMPLNVLAT